MHLIANEKRVYRLLLANTKKHKTKDKLFYHQL
jgi:hypothetical protein